MAKANRITFTPSEDQKKAILRNSVWYEILYTFGVPAHDPTDYCQWEAINFTRMGHARVLYSFLETNLQKRYQDDVLAEDYGYPAAMIDLPKEDRARLNKDLFHMTYARLRHTPATKPWPNSILSNLHAPCIYFMQYMSNQPQLFYTNDGLREWTQLLDLLKSGRELRIHCTVGPDNSSNYALSLGAPLPEGKSILTRLQPA